MSTPLDQFAAENSPPPDATSLVALTRAEIDGQIATAHAFPRSLADFIREATSLVTLDQDTAEACIYSLPRKDKDGREIFIAGASVRFAEILLATYGNCRIGGRVVATDQDTITGQGVFHDLQKNVMVTKEVQRRIVNKFGKRFNADMIQVTGNATVSLALRNAVLTGIPKAIWLPIYEKARLCAVGDVTTLAKQRANAIAWFAKAGISAEQIFAKLGIKGVDDITLEHLEVLVGLKTAIRDGGKTPETVFEVEPEGNKPPAGVSHDTRAAADLLAGKGKKPVERDPDTGEVLPDDL